jgi:serine/threonine-protein kinase
MNRLDSPPSRNFGEASAQTLGPATPKMRTWMGEAIDDEDELVGSTLGGNYLIERVLGEGGMGRVYLATHTRIAGKRFAIKTLHLEYLRHGEAVTRFRREAEAAASIASPNVVGVYDVDKTPDGRPFIVCEYLEGIELGELLDRHGRLPVDVAVRIVRQVCSALAAAHDKGVVHRDIKPENVFLVGDPREPTAKVLDFGISRLDDSAGKSITRTGFVMGTPGYMAPEQARGERVDHRADVYAVGALLYATLTGKAPFDRDDPNATLVAVLTEEPQRPRSIEPSIPEHLELVVQKSMARERDVRYQSMGDLAEALAPYDRGEPLPGRGALWGAQAGSAGDRAARVAPTIVGEASREARDARPWLVTLALAALVAVAMLVVSATRGLVRAAGGELGALGWTVLWLTVAMAAATPSFLVVRRVHREVWSNTPRVLELTSALRVPLVAGALAYGAAALLVRFVEDVLLGRPAGHAWPVWDTVLLVIAAATAMAARRRVASPLVLVGLVAAACALVIPVAAMVRGPDDAAAASHDPGLPAAPTAAIAGEPPTASSAAEPASVSAEELAQAKQKGLAALEELGRVHPQDDAVLRELSLALARQPGRRVDALAVMDLLLSRSPDEAGALEPALLDCAEGDGGKKALEIMATKMQSRGPDLLYKVAQSKPALKSQAEALLSDPTVRARATPALQVALELKDAPTCGAKRALLERAAEHGDARAVDILRPLTQRSSRGCGFLGMSACAAKCKAEAQEMQSTIDRIQARLAASPR